MWFISEWYETLSSLLLSICSSRFLYTTGANLYPWCRYGAHHVHHRPRSRCRTLDARAYLGHWRGGGLYLSLVIFGVLTDASILGAMMLYSCFSIGFHGYKIVSYEILVFRSMSYSELSLSSNLMELPEVVFMAFEVPPMKYSSSDLLGDTVSSSVWMILNNSLV